MIPKIIHYCWLSDDAIPEDLLSYIDNWKKIMPEYQFVLWDKERFDINSVDWVKEAYYAKKYAFAADYIRLYAVYNYGGIYLDSDVDVIKSFDPLLHFPYFFGLEFNNRLIEAATFGAEPKNKWIKRCLDYYKDRHFVNNKGAYDQVVLPKIMKSILLDESKPVIHTYMPEIYNPNLLNVFSWDFFSPKSFYSDRIVVSDNTFSIHCFKTAWMSPMDRFWRNIKFLARKFFLYNLR